MLIMSNETPKTIPFNTRKSRSKLYPTQSESKTWELVSDNNTYTWSSKMDRVKIIRHGIPYQSIEQVSKKLDRPVKVLLSLVGMPQTTYNKKKSENSLLDSRNSELILLIIELVDYGMDVFNQEEEKFQRWLKKPNISLSGAAPESLLDTSTGIAEVMNALNRIEFGNFA
jgi:putative toxin-antitoxin system antitoxin component (TIGR02293 family)